MISSIKDIVFNSNAYDVIITIWRYLTPIFYPYESLPDWLQLFVKYANPMFSYVHSFRQICLYGECVDFFVFGIGWIYSIAFFSAGLFFFSKMKKHFILYIQSQSPLQGEAFETGTYSTDSRQWFRCCCKSWYQPLLHQGIAFEQSPYN